MSSKPGVDSSCPKVYIIIVNWNGWKDTVECLRSLRELQYANYAAIVVDNGSTDESVHKIQNLFNNITIIQSEKNRGYAGGNNVGIRYALEHQADYVWLLNNDTVVDEFALSPLVKRMTKNSEIGICGSKVIYYHQQDTVQVLAGGSYNKWFGLPVNFGQFSSANRTINVENIESRLDFIIGASMLVSRSFLETVGLLSEDYFLYYEEIDWGIRAKGNYKLGFAADSIVYHKEGASIGATNRRKNDKSHMADYYMIKNRLKITWKFYPWLLPFIYITNLYSIFNRMRRNQWDRIPMILKLFFTFNSSSRY